MPSVMGVASTILGPGWSAASAAGPGRQVPFGQHTISLHELSALQSKSPSAAQLEDGTPCHLELMLPVT